MRLKTLLIVLLLFGIVTPCYSQVPESRILTNATQFFHLASQGYAQVLIPPMKSVLFALTNLSMALFVMGLLFRVDLYALLEALLWFSILCGACLMGVERASGWVEMTFQGIRQLAYMCGAPNLDPSAVAGYGLVLADPIMKSLADGGFFSFMSSPTMWVFMAAGLSIMLAFALLAFVLMALLIQSYLLIAAAPFFLAWAVLPFTRGIATGYLRATFGCMNGLFCVMLMTAVISNLGAELERELRLHFLAPGVTLTLSDYGAILMVGIALICLFPSIPYVWARSIDGIMMLDWSGGRSLMHAGSTVVNTTMPSPGGSQHVQKEGGGHAALNAATSSTIGMSPPGNRQHSSSWSKKP